MKFWLYQIDWRSLAVEVLAECNTEREAIAKHEHHIASLSKEQLLETVNYKTVARTPVSAEMEASREQFLRVNGRVA